MIFVTVGTNEARFDRLLQGVAEVATDEPVVIQHGHSTPIGPRTAALVDFLSFDQMVETIQKARVVISHAGVGSIMVALANGKRPVVVPRRAEFGEAVDDHQLQLGRRLAIAGLVTFVDSPRDLAVVIDASHEEVQASSTRGTRLADDLRSYFREVLAAENG
jgi:UDP-N-acetylglucosamine transferase subunit ALG13